MYGQLKAIQLWGKQSDPSCFPLASRELWQHPVKWELILRSEFLRLLENLPLGLQDPGKRNVWS